MFKNCSTWVAISAIALSVTACSTVAEKTNMLSDADLVTKGANALGVEYTDVTLVSKRVDGTNTYFVVKNKNGKAYNCQLNGGNLLSFGMTNPTSCVPK